MKNLENFKRSGQKPYYRLLGYTTPKKYLHTSASVFKKQAQEFEIRKKRKAIKYSFFSATAVAATLAIILVFFPVYQTDSLLLSSFEEDTFVTQLLMDTLLVEGSELDEILQESMLDDFEASLVQN